MAHSKDIKARLEKVSQDIERLGHIRSIVDSQYGINAREQVCAAAAIASEYVASLTGNQAEVGMIHRAYEEILAAIEDSPAISEMLQWNQVPAHKEAEVRESLEEHWIQFRLALAGRD